jgi:hypothetical protein
VIVGKIREKQGKKLSFHKIRSVASAEYTKWINNPRMILFMVLFVFIYDYVIEELLIVADKMDGYLMILEPFIATSNSELLMLVIPAVFIVLMSDFPKTDGNTMFYIQRVGKSNWIFGQMLFGVKAAVSYLFGIIVISFVMVARQAYAKNIWSTVITEYVQRFPDESRSRIPLLINDRLYNNLTPVQAFLITVTMLLLYLICLELMLLVGFAMGKRMIGMIISYTVIAVGSSLCGLDSAAKWLFPSAHSIAWVHFDPVLRIQKVHIGYSYLYFGVLFVMLFVFSLIRIGRYDFAKITDMED